MISRVNHDIEILKSVPFKYGLVELRTDNIITIESLDGINTFTLEHVKEIHRIALELTNGTPLPCLFENTNYKKNVNIEVNVYTNKHLHEFASACAVIENSSLTRFFIHAYLQLFGAQMPIKLFKEIPAAIKWLQSA